MTKLETVAPPSLPTITDCALCGADSVLADRVLSGYQAGREYRVYQCMQCGTARVAPLCAVAEIYQLIYAQPERIPGYARYVAYAQAVENHPQPLVYLAAQEECYWGIAAALQRHLPAGPVNILEVGCGMGYLTCALQRSGYARVLGIDVSPTAIAAARRRYGEFYQVADIMTFATHSDERFDAIVMTEVIEHLEQPLALIRAASDLLKPGGVLICTTPNRDFGGWRQQTWATDLPPLHLWWFGEGSLRLLAQRPGLRLDFVDFTAWNRSHYRRYQKALRRSQATGQNLEPVFDSDGLPCAPKPSVHRATLTAQQRPLERWQNLLYRARFPTQWSGQAIRQSPCLCAVFQKPAMTVESQP